MKMGKRLEKDCNTTLEKHITVLLGSGEICILYILMNPLLGSETAAADDL